MRLLIRSCASIVLIVTFLSNSPALAQGATGKDAPFSTTTAKGIDESLFLMRALETTYARWPRNTSDRRVLENWLVASRAQISRLRAVIEAKKLDSEIGKLYDDCLNLQSTYEIYLVNLGAIDRNTLAQARRDQSKVNQAAASSAFDGAKFANKNGGDAGDALVVGTIAALVGGAFEDYERGKARDAAKRNALAVERRKVDAAWLTTKSRAEVYAERIAKRRGWKPGEAGFDGYTSRNYSDYLKRRPRDPFLWVAMSQAKLKNETAETLMRDAHRCLQQVRQVPAGRAYDGFRVEFATAAADRAVTAAMSELPAYSAGPTKRSQEAIRMCNTLAALDPTDSTGKRHALIARAYAGCGRYNEAIRAANAALKKSKVWGQDISFSLRYARFMSLTKQYKAAGDWLAHAYKRGLTDVKYIRKDKDFANFRAGDPARYKTLTTPKLTYRVKFGIINDDIIVTNHGPFDLTNLKLNVVIRQGTRVWKPSLKLARLRAGTSYTFSDVVSIPNSRYDKIDATLWTDQD